MTRNNFKIKKKFKLKPMVSVVLIFVIVFSSMIVLANIKRRNLMFDEQVFYFVYANSSKQNLWSESEKNLINNLSGASVSYKSGEIYYLTANVYLDQVGAGEVKNRISAYFPTAGVLSVKTKKISRKTKREIIKRKQIFEFVKFIHQFSKDFQNLELEYLSGEVSEGRFVSKLISARTELEKISEGIDSNDEFCCVYKEYSQLFLLQLFSFLNGFFNLSSKQSGVCSYYVGFIANYIEFYNSL